MSILPQTGWWGESTPHHSAVNAEQALHSRALHCFLIPVENGEFSVFLKMLHWYSHTRSYRNETKHMVGSSGGWLEHSQLKLALPVFKAWNVSSIYVRKEWLALISSTQKPPTDFLWSFSTWANCPGKPDKHLWVNCDLRVCKFQWLLLFLCILLFVLHLYVTRVGRAH